MVDPFRYTRALFDDEWPSSDTHPTDPQTIPPITGKVKDAGQIYIIIILVGWSWSLLHTPPIERRDSEGVDGAGGGFP